MKYLFIVLLITSLIGCGQSLTAQNKEINILRVRIVNLENAIGELKDAKILVLSSTRSDGEYMLNFYKSPRTMVIEHKLLMDYFKLELVTEEFKFAENKYLLKQKCKPSEEK